MRIKSYALTLSLFVLLITGSAHAMQSDESCEKQTKLELGKSQAAKKSNDQPSHHLNGVNERGDTAMGFSHDKTTHRFRLSANGGAIEVSANDPQDTKSRDQIRMHLSHIAALFKEGDFTNPMFIHDKTPPGVPALIRLKSKITYSFQESELGARVRITTANHEALAAIHEFLRFQIKDHQTGDSLEVTPDN